MKEVTCPFCMHIQKTRTKLVRVTCSSCGKKFPIVNLNPINKIEEKNLQTNINTEELKRVKLD